MFGDVIKAYRLERGWKQQELARRAGLGQAHISLIERNSVPKPSPDTLSGLARAFGITVDELLHVAGMDQAPTLSSLEQDLEDWTTRITALGPQLNPTQRAAVLEHAEALQRQS